MLGFLNILKPKDVSSNYVVQTIKKLGHFDKIGHLGTLDPMASGVLPIAVGKATRLFDYALAKTKEYIAVFDFGYTTDTLDITGKVETSGGKVPSLSEILAVLPKFVGKFDQMPPRFSAKNINGKRAYDLARKGVDFELLPKQIEIFEIACLGGVGDSAFKFKIKCSSGTYIRSICRDLGVCLGTVACMSGLKRTSCGKFSIDTAVPLEKLSEYGDIGDLIIPPTKVFDFPIIDIPKQTLIDVLNGKDVPFEKLDRPTFIASDGKLLGVAKTGLETLKIDVNLYE